MYWLLRPSFWLFFYSRYEPDSWGLVVVPWQLKNFNNNTKWDTSWLWLVLRTHIKWSCWKGSLKKKTSFLSNAPVIFKQPYCFLSSVPIVQITWHRKDRTKFHIRLLSTNICLPSCWCKCRQRLQFVAL